MSKQHIYYFCEENRIYEVDDFVYIGTSDDMFDDGSPFHWVLKLNKHKIKELLLEKEGCIYLGEL